MEKKIRVLVAKPGLDGHDRGALVIAQGLRDEGMEVIYSGLRQTPEQIVAAAIQEDVDVIGLSILSGAHNELFPEITKLLKENDAEDILVIGGGIIPEDDIPFLKEHGIIAIFTPGTPISKIAEFIKEAVKKNSSNQESSFSVKKIEHIGIAVKDLHQATVFFEKTLGLQLLGIEEVESEGVKVAFLKAGEVKIELLEPLSKESPIHKHLEKRGEGIHHLAFEVDNIINTFNAMKNKNISLLQEEPKNGAHGKKVGFIHPKDSYKVLLEFVEKEKEK